MYVHMYIHMHVHTHTHDTHTTGQVLLVKEGLGSAQEHVHSCLRCLDKLSAPQPPTPDVDGQVPSEAPLASDEQTMEEVGETCDNEDTSDDEMVLEPLLTTVMVTFLRYVLFLFPYNAFTE